MGICLVLGGGGARGIAHLGVLKVLVKNNIPIDHVIGTSAGALIGGLYAYNPDIEWLEELVVNTKKSDLIKRNWSTLKGYTNGNAYLTYMRKHINNADFKDLKIPFTAIAADVHTGELVAIDEGDVAMAQLCSSALPPIYTPVNYMNRTLFDGGCVQTVPSEYARSIHNENKKVVAVNVGVNMPISKPRFFRSMFLQFMHIRSIYFDRHCAKGADVVIRPDIPGASILDDEQKDLYIAKGVEAAEAKIDDILAMLND